MAPKIIVSYDDTDNDRDALALGRALADAGATVSLAYVEHHRDDDPHTSGARELLDRGAAAIGLPDAPRHVVLSGSTGDGLRALVEREQADVVVFGSDYRTPAGAVRPGTSAERLLDGGPAAIALAPAGLREHGAEIRTVGLLADDGGPAYATAHALARAVGGAVLTPAEGPVDLLVVASRPEAPSGRVAVSAATAYAIETARSPVLVVRRDVAVPFAARTATTA
jgi:nucleotide-binding universal stress UspA family protein